MLDRVFPRKLDNAYRGHWLGLAIFVPLVLLQLIIGGNSIINTRTVAMGADGIPLDSFGNGGAQEVILEFALLGLWRLLFALLGILALVRYRAMVPLHYLLLLFQQLAGKAIHYTHATGGGLAQAGSIVTTVLLGMALLGFALSLLGKSEGPGRSS